MKLQLLDTPIQRTLTAVNDDGTTVYRKQSNGNPYQVPSWCSMSMEEHACAWGCMGVLNGYVEKDGRNYCKCCELYVPEDSEVFVLKTGVLHNEKEFHNYACLLESIMGLGYPMRYPAIAIIIRRQVKNEFGFNAFVAETEIVYPDEFKGHSAIKQTDYDY